jgi:hypothetical protein
MIHQVLRRLANKPPAPVRRRAWQNLLMATVNAALGRRLITLDRQPFDDTSFEFEPAGLPVLAHVRGTGVGEVKIDAIVNTKEAYVDDDDDTYESLEADADAAIGFSEQRAELRRALRALWHGSPELKRERRGLSPDKKTATREVAAR